MEEPIWRLEWIKAFEKTGLSDRAISLKADLSATFWRDAIQRKQEPRLGSFVKMCRALGLDPGALINEQYRPVKTGVGARAELEDLLSVALTRQAVAPEPLPDFVGTLVESVESWLLPPESNPATDRTPAPKPPAGNRASPQPSSANKLRKRR